MAVQLEVFRIADHTRAAGTQLLQDPIVRNAKWFDRSWR